MKDTDLQASRAWIDLLRRAGTAGRAQMANRLSADVRWRARRALQRRYAALSARDQLLLLLELNHGRELADRVRSYRPTAVKVE